MHQICDAELFAEVTDELERLKEERRKIREDKAAGTDTAKREAPPI